MVVIACPAAAPTGITQDRLGLPSKCTVQAPQSAAPQPNFVPFMPSKSRRTHSSGMSGGASTVWGLPLIFKVIMANLRGCRRCPIPASFAWISHAEIYASPVNANLLNLGIAWGALGLKLRREGDSQRGGHPHEVGEGVGLHLTHHLASVRLHGDFGRAESGRDLFVEETGDDARHDFTLAAGQRGVPLAKPFELGRLAERRPAALERSSDRREQHVIVEWLGEELDGSGFHRANRPRNVAVAGQEDDGHLAAIPGDPLLQLETVQPRQLDVQNQTVRYLGGLA